MYRCFSRHPPWPLQRLPPLLQKGGAGVGVAGLSYVKMLTNNKFFLLPHPIFASNLKLMLQSMIIQSMIFFSLLFTGAAVAICAPAVSSPNFNPFPFSFCQAARNAGWFTTSGISCSERPCRAVPASLEESPVRHVASAETDGKAGTTRRHRGVLLCPRCSGRASP